MNDGVVSIGDNDEPRKKRGEFNSDQRVRQRLQSRFFEVECEDNEASTHACREGIQKSAE